MNRRTLVVLIAILSVLIAGVVAVQRAQKPVESQASALSGVSADQVSQISLTVSGSTVTLRAVDGAWRIVAPFDDRANADATGRIINSLIYTRLGSVLSENPSHHDRYDVQPAGAIRLQVFVKNKTEPAIDYWVGKPTEMGQSCFVRVGDSPQVRVAEGLPPQLLFRNPEEFRSPYVTPVDPEKAASLSAAGAVAVSLKTSSTVWVNEGNQKIVPGDARQDVLNAVRHWISAGFAASEAGPGQGFDKPFLSVTVGTPGGPVTITVGKPVPNKTPAQRYVRVSDRAVILLVDDTLTQAVIDALKKTL